MNIYYFLYSKHLLFILDSPPDRKRNQNNALNTIWSLSEQNIECYYELKICCLKYVISLQIIDLSTCSLLAISDWLVSSLLNSSITLALRHSMIWFCCIFVLICYILLRSNFSCVACLRLQYFLNASFNSCYSKYYLSMQQALHSYCKEDSYAIKSTLCSQSVN